MNHVLGHKQKRDYTFVCKQQELIKWFVKTNIKIKMKGIAVKKNTKMNITNYLYVQID